MKEKFLALLILAPIVLAIGGVIMALPWMAWCWVVPQIYPDGPEKLINPSYLLFVVAWILIGYIGRRIFGRRSA